MRDRASIIVSICGALLAVALISVALVSELPPQATQLTDWLHNATVLLTIADEVLMFATITLLAAAVYMYQKLSSRHSLSAALGLAAWGVSSVGFVIAVLAIGRLIYPVNGLSIESEFVAYSVAQVFSSLHLASIGLGVGVLAFGWALRTRIPLAASVVVGLLQCAGTYFAGPTPVWLLIVAAVAWLGWIIAVGAALRERRKL